MVLSNNRKKRANLTIDELFKRPQPNRSQHEDEDLLFAMRLSQQEHVNEQKKLLDKYSSLSQKRFKSIESSSKKRRLIKPEAEEESEDDDERVQDFTDDEDEGQWFQTVSTRVQRPVKKVEAKPPPQQKRKQKERLVENSNKNIPSKATLRNKDTPDIKQDDDDDGMMLEINNNVDEWLDAKLEKTETLDMVEIDDIDAYLNEVEDEQERPVVTIDDELIACPVCQKRFERGKEIQEHAAQCNNMVSDMDSDSDCDIIDLINPANNVISKQTYTEAKEDDDDGYLSPLEGFTSIQKDQNEAFNPYFDQLQPKPKATRATRGTTKRSPRGKSRSKWYKKKRKS